MMTVKNGLYSIRIEMKDGGRGRATGVIVLLDGQILGGDTHFYYAGSYTFKNGKWRGELITHQHTEAFGMTLLFAGREPAGLRGPIPMEKQRSTEPRGSGKTAFRFMPS
jgi:hypothetical protein